MSGIAVTADECLKELSTTTSMQTYDPIVAKDFDWERRFCISLAPTITLAVNLLGVLVVFAFLIIPAFADCRNPGVFDAIRIALRSIRPAHVSRQY